MSWRRRRRRPKRLPLLGPAAVLATVAAFEVASAFVPGCVSAPRPPSVAVRVLLSVAVRGGVSAVAASGLAAGV